MFIQIGISLSTSEIRTWKGRRKCESILWVKREHQNMEEHSLTHPFHSQNISRPRLHSGNLSLVAEKGVTQQSD